MVAAPKQKMNMRGLVCNARAIGKEHQYEYVMITERGMCYVNLRKKKRKTPISSDPIRQKYPHGQAIKI